MKHALLIAFIVLGIHYSVAQQVDSLRLEQMITKLSQTEQEIKQLKGNIRTLSTDVKSLKQENKKLHADIDSLCSMNEQLNETQNADRSAVNQRIDDTNNAVNANHATVKNHTTYFIVATVAIFVLLSVVAFWLAKRINRGSNSIDQVRKAQEALQAAQTKMQEESITLDNRLLEIVEKQIATGPKSSTPTAPDHSLTLKVGDEIARIEQNLSRMDASVKGYKQLSRAVQKIKDNFRANGYEIVDMLGKPYNEGMKVIANFVIDENLEQGQQIITGITKPQINYNGQMIQAAQITVSQNI